uniref:Uncharacterized protein n=1 Tax=Salix viminalis TaxID=40686 RepID=A0A6N2N6N8_SALVM
MHSYLIIMRCHSLIDVFPKFDHQDTFFCDFDAGFRSTTPDKFNGVPRIEEVGGQEELEREISRRTKSSKGQQEKEIKDPGS